jgi:phosphoglycerate kinase
MSDVKNIDQLIGDFKAGALSGDIVLVRADLNVPLDDDGKVRDATRLTRLLPSLKALSEAGLRVGVLSHFGRPKGQIVAEMSLAPIADALSALVNQNVSFAAHCTGPEAEAALQSLPAGGICVLENTRFHAGEEANDAEFAGAMAAPAAAYVNDAFSAAHRAHASTEAITKHLPSYTGLAMQAELDALDAALANPARPLVAVVGGAKISTKLDLLSNLSAKVDSLIIGGGMANTFLAAQGHAIGTSLCEDTMLDTARAIMSEAEKQGCRILLPGEICQAFDEAATLIWNGPLGAFEITPFDTATNKAAQYAAARTKAGDLVSVAGGGDTVAALNQAGAGQDFTYVSTAGGAFLEWLEGKPLPGVDALRQNT